MPDRISPHIESPLEGEWRAERERAAEVMRADIAAATKPDPRDAVVLAAVALLQRLEDITTEEFALGGERAEREALEAALIAAGVK